MCDCANSKCIRDGCLSCCYCGAPFDLTGEIMGHPTDNDRSPEIELELEALDQALKAGQSDSAPDGLVQGAALQIEDLSVRAYRYLSHKAFQALQNKSKSQIHVVDDQGVQRVYKAVYFANMVKKGNEEKALQNLSSILNYLAEYDFIYSCLAPPSSISLAQVSLQAPTCAVFCFVLVPEGNYEDIMGRFKDRGATLEGGLGSALEDLSPELNEGEFLAELRFSHALFTHKSFDEEAFVQEEIQRYLSVLPRGTVVMSIRNCSIYDLSVTKEIKFYNPLMKEVKYVEFDYVRHAVAIHPGHIDQFSLLVQVRYLNKEKKDIHQSFFPQERQRL